MSRYVSDKLRQTVIRRAGNRCEYCLLPQSARVIKHQIEHILPLQHDGRTTAENLALACSRCNLNKGTNVAVYDLVTTNLTPLFNPRTQVWLEHFQITDNGMIESLTASARVTIRILRFNDEERIEERRELITAGLY